MLYAIVDIETTGSYANASGITEIAIIVTDGEKIIEQYETLINPLQKIPYFITRLTGINDAMVASAPSFDEVAKKVYTILNDKIFVAHNVNFDYSFVNAQLKENGYQLQNKKLCTVRYGRKVMPGLRSYSLGNFCKTIGIPVENRHRAGGDCIATYYLLKKLLEQDAEGIIDTLLKNKTKEKNLPLQLSKENYHSLPTGVGVYYFLDSKEKIIYIGKALNIKKRVASHFSGNNTSKQRQEFIRNIASIRYTLVATELMSLLLESTEIKKYWPKYNKSQKQYEHQFALYSYFDQNGYLRLCVEKKKKNLQPIITVKNKVDGLLQLRKMVTDFNLCPNFCQVPYIAENSTHQHCNGICTEHQNDTNYNDAVQNAISNLQNNTPSYCIIDEGLQDNEKSVIVVEKGNFIGMGYLPEKIKNFSTAIVTPYIELYKTNHYIDALVKNFATTQPTKVMPI